MKPAARTVTFIPLAPFAQRARRRIHYCSHARRIASPSRRLHMSAVPLPDETALDMLSFAMSGPGLLAGGLLTLSGLAVILFFGEVGPRRVDTRTFFFLRLNIPSPVHVELPDGSVRNLRAGETVLRLPTREACSAVARTLPQDGLTYSLYRASAGSMVLLQTFPKDVNAKGGAWPSNVVQKSDQGLLDARWEEYQRLGETSDVDQEWSDVMGSLTPLQIDRKECKLCGGAGFKTCYKCGGASGTYKAGSSFECDCDGGRRRCEWCATESRQE